eukprot:365619_1
MLFIKLWVVLLIAIEVLGIVNIWMDSTFILVKLNDNDKYSMCVWDDFGLRESNTFSLVAATVHFAANIISFIAFNLSFVIYTYRTLLHTKCYNPETRDSYEKLQKV